MTSEIVPTRPPSIAEIAADLEAVCTEIDMENGEIKPELMKRFEFAQLALRDKCDRWIGYIDGLKGAIATLKSRSDRASAALRTAQSFEKQLKFYMKQVLEQNPNLTFKGEGGTIYLHGEGDKIKYNFKFGDKSVAEVVETAFIDMEPTVRPYLIDVTHQVINKEKLKADLLAGVKLNWAELYKGSHVRLKG